MDYKTNIEAELKTAAALAEDALEGALSPAFTGNTVVGEAMRYSTLGGGKRIRAYLVLAFCTLFGGTNQAALPFACALECVHAYSLIHDDLPCMDDDALRRGKPSCHIRFGEAEALLAGDALLTYAFECAASNAYVSAGSVRLAVKTLAAEAGPRGMVGGQTLDMAAEMKDYGELCAMIDGKTSALIRAACLLGYYAATDEADPAVIEKITAYANAIGLGFQIHDDILDVTSDTATLGKEVGSDEKNGKKTALAFMTLDEARKTEEDLVRHAREAVAGFEGSEALADLALWLSRRNK
ncbi:MAG: polyprenyl synthetase family protein [Clostridia bacterium]|nr:polyprenyl synthetase family protein [Clostridia bacterium]